MDKYDRKELINKYRLKFQDKPLFNRFVRLVGLDFERGEMSFEEAIAGVYIAYYISDTRNMKETKDEKI